MRQEEYGEDTEEHGDASFYEEDEWPSFVVASVNFGKTRGEKSTECTRQWGCTIEQTNSEHQLMTPVKHREVDDHAAQETALHETQEEARDNKPGEAFHKNPYTFPPIPTL